MESGFLENVVCCLHDFFHRMLYMQLIWSGVFGVYGERWYLCKPGSSIFWDGREHWPSPNIQLSILTPRKLSGITVATPRYTASAGGLNEVRGRWVIIGGCKKEKETLIQNLRCLAATSSHGKGFRNKPRGKIRSRSP